MSEEEVKEEEDEDEVKEEEVKEEEVKEEEEKEKNLRSKIKGKGLKKPLPDETSSNQPPLKKRRWTKRHSGLQLSPLDKPLQLQRPDQLLNKKRKRRSQKRERAETWDGTGHF